MEEMDGATLIGTSLKTQGVDYLFGIVGIPIVEVAVAAQTAGVNYIGMRNEQAASYAASAVGYLNKWPAACLVVPGPGLVHALAGLANAYVNCWPMVVIAGSFDQDQVSMGGFQEWPQVESCRQCCKYCVRIETLESIPYHIEKAVRTAAYGRPGPCYVEIPGNLVTSTVTMTTSLIPRCPDPPITFADPLSVKKAAATLRAAVRPLVIIGKGAAYSQAEKELTLLISRHHLPFLPTPMGKGVLPDDHPLCVAAARSKALRQSDVILLVGARLNWILHFGLPPRFNQSVKILQVDLCAEEMCNNVPSSVMMCGDCAAIINQLNCELSDGPFYHCNPDGEWWVELREKVCANVQLNKSLSDDTQLPMSFYAAYKEITKVLPRNVTIVNEGSTTMDIGRTVLQSYYPRQRLDAGTFGTMGVGCGFAIAASLLAKSMATPPGGQRSPVVCIQGDSAFGFSGMEVETACRYELPIVFLIMNNNGIYRGLDEETWEAIKDEPLPLSLPPNLLTPNIKYNKMAECFGAKGYDCHTPTELRETLALVLSESNRKLPVIINVVIRPTSVRRAQEFSWLTKSKL